MATSSNPIVVAAQAAQSAVDTSTSGIVSARNSAADLSNADASLALDTGANNVIIQQAKSQSDLAQQNARLKAGQVFGADLSLGGELISGLTQQYLGAEDQKAAAAKSIQEKRSVGFMDNPLQHILNLFTINDDIDNYNAANTVSQDSAQKIQTLNQLSDQTARNQANFAAPITQASIDAGAKNLVNTAQAAANKSTIEGLNQNISALQDTMQASIQKLKITSEVQADARAQAHLGLAMQEAARHREQFEWQMEARKDDADFQAQTVENIRKGLIKMMGANAPDPTTSPQAAKYWIKTLGMPNTPQGRQANVALFMGQTGIIGGTPDQVMTDLNSNIGIKIPESQALIGKLYQDVQGDVAKMAQLQPPKNKEEMATLVNKAMNARLSGPQGYVNTIGKNTDNPLTINGMSSVITQPGVVDTALVQKVLAPIVGPFNLDNQDLVFTTGLAAVKAGTISQMDLVRGLEAMYTKGAAMNRDTKDFLKYGIIPTPDMLKYRADVTTGSSFSPSAKATVDLTSSDDIAAAVNKSLAYARLRETGFVNPFTNQVGVGNPSFIPGR